MELELGKTKVVKQDVKMWYVLGEGILRGKDCGFTSIFAAPATAPGTMRTFKCL